MIEIIALGIFILFIGIFIFNGVLVIPLNKVFVVEKLGAGIHYIIPFVNKVVDVVELSERVFETNEAMFRTYDDKTVTLTVKITYQVTDPKVYHYSFNKDLYKMQETAYDQIRYVILQNTLQDIKMDLLSLEQQLLLQIIL